MELGRGRTCNLACRTEGFFCKNRPGGLPDGAHGAPLFAHTACCGHAGAPRPNMPVEPGQRRPRSIWACAHLNPPPSALERPSIAREGSAPESDVCQMPTILYTYMGCMLVRARQPQASTAKGGAAPVRGTGNQQSERTERAAQVCRPRPRTQTVRETCLVPSQGPCAPDRGSGTSTSTLSGGASCVEGPWQRY